MDFAEGILMHALVDRDVGVVPLSLAVLQHLPGFDIHLLYIGTENEAVSVKSLLIIVVGADEPPFEDTIRVSLFFICLAFWLLITC